MPLQYMLKICNNEARQIREEIEMKEAVTNIKFIGKCAVKVKENIANGSIKEVIRKVDAIEMENNYIKEKFRCNSEYVDCKARNALPANKVTSLAIKCANGHDPHGLRDSSINKHQ